MRVLMRLPPLILGLIIKRQPPPRPTHQRDQAAVELRVLLIKRHPVLGVLRRPQIIRNGMLILPLLLAPRVQSLIQGLLSVVVGVFVLGDVVLGFLDNCRLVRGEEGAGLGFVLLVFCGDWLADVLEAFGEEDLVGSGRLELL